MSTAVSTDVRPQRTAPAVAAGTSWDRPALAALVVLVLGAALDAPLLTLAALVSLMTVLLARRLPRDLALPAAVLLLLAVAAALGSAAALVGVDLLSHPWLLLGVELAGGGLLVRRPGRDRTLPAVDRWSVLGYVPAGIAAVVGGLQAFGPLRSWALVGTDIAEHTVLLGQVQQTGRLDYATEPYPRALHMLLALTSGPRTPHARSAALLLQDLHLMAAVVWLSLAVLLVAAVALTRRTAIAMNLGARTAGVAAALVSWLVLTSVALQLAFVHMGAAPSLLAVVLLWSIPAVALLYPDRPGLVALTGVAAFGLVAHLWQALVLGPVVTAVVVGLLWLRAPRPRRAAWTPAVVLLTVLAAGPLIGVQRAGGVSLAAIAGEIGRVPLAAAVMAVVGLVLALVRLPRLTAVAWMTTALGLLGTVGYLASGAGWSLSSYYPMKALWFAVLFLAPLAAVAAAAAGSWLVTRCWAALGSYPTSRRLTRPGLAAAVALLLVGLTVPGVVSSGSVLRAAVTPIASHDLIQRRLELGSTLPGTVPGTVVVPSALALNGAQVQYGAYVTSKLLRFQSGQPTSYGNPERVCQDVIAVARGQQAVVVTDLPVPVMHAVMALHGCGNVPVVRAGGSDPGWVKRATDALRKSGELGGRP